MQPQVVSDVDIAFPGTVGHLMPAYADIPEEFKNDRNPYADLARKWFFTGLEGNEIVCKSDVDEDTALRHLASVIGSFEPKHEHKMAAVAYLMSQWFELT